MLKHVEDFAEDAFEIVVHLDATLVDEAVDVDLLVKKVAAMLHAQWLDGYNDGFLDSAKAT